MSNILISSSTS